MRSPSTNDLPGRSQAARLVFVAIVTLWPCERLRALTPAQEARVVDLEVYEGVPRGEAVAYVLESDRIRSSIAAPDGGGPGWVLLDRVRATDVGDARIAEYWRSHPELFGSRSMEDCAPGIRRILQVRDVRASISGDMPVAAPLELRTADARSEDHHGP